MISWAYSISPLPLSQLRFISSGVHRNPNDHHSQYTSANASRLLYDFIQLKAWGLQLYKDFFINDFGGCLLSLFSVRY